MCVCVSGKKAPPKKSQQFKVEKSPRDFLGAFFRGHNNYGGFFPYISDLLKSTYILYTFVIGKKPLVSS